MTTIVLDELIPARCWIAPEIPIAMYRFGLTANPVCPTCSSCGRQPASETGLEHAVAAPKTSANSSIIFQFSGPFNPRPADTTIFASGNGILSVACMISLTTVDKSVAATCGWKASISTVVCASTASMVFRSEEHTSELQSRENLVCRLLLEKKK